MAFFSINLNMLITDYFPFSQTNFYLEYVGFNVWNFHWRVWENFRVIFSYYATKCLFSWKSLKNFLEIFKNLDLKIFLPKRLCPPSSFLFTIIQYNIIFKKLELFIKLLGTGKNTDLRNFRNWTIIFLIINAERVF